MVFLNPDQRAQCWLADGAPAKQRNAPMPELSRRCDLSRPSSPSQVTRAQTLSHPFRVQKTDDDDPLKTHRADARCTKAKVFPQSPRRADGESCPAARPPTPTAFPCLSQASGPSGPHTASSRGHMLQS